MKTNEYSSHKDAKDLMELNQRYIKAKEQYLDTINNPNSEKAEIEFDKDMMETCKKTLGNKIVDLWIEEIITINFNSKEEVK
jgi:hypothetical protein